MKFEDMVDTMTERTGMPRSTILRSSVLSLLIVTGNPFLACVEEDIDDDLAYKIIEDATLAALEVSSSLG